MRSVVKEECEGRLDDGVAAFSEERSREDKGCEVAKAREG